MKKNLTIILMLSAMVLSACGSDDDDTKNNDTNNKGSCSTTEYKNSAGDCTALTECTADEEETTAPTATSDRVCTAKTGGCTAEQYKNTAGDCTALTICTADEDETTAPTATSDRVCTIKGCVESTVVGPCDALCQTGCADAQTCVAGVFAQGQPAEEICQPVGPGTQGVACGQDAACAIGFGCLGGTCVKYCRLPNGTPDCGNGESCIPGIAQGANIGICRASCTFFPDSCIAAEKCVAVSATDTTCVSAGAKAKGENCVPGECGKSLGCIGPQGGQAVCRTLCDNANPTQCDAGANETCTMLGATAPFGACIPPA